jgi:signal peptidase I
MRAMSRSLPATAIVAAVLFVGCGSGGEARTYRVPSGSMKPTYAVGDEVEYTARQDAAVGEVVIFYPPSGAATNECGSREGPFYAGEQGRVACSRATEGRASHLFIKRVVAVGGDRIGIEDGYAVLNGQRQEEPFIEACDTNGPDCNLDAVTVPDGTVFVLGDNRGASDDSRYWGPVPTSSIVGVVED